MKSYENFRFAENFHVERGSGFRSHLNVYLDPKHWLKIFAETEILCENVRLSANRILKKSKSVTKF
jgi:hypothetical protein